MLKQNATDIRLLKVVYGILFEKTWPEKCAQNQGR
jgi:hypothetical protein